MEAIIRDASDGEEIGQDVSRLIIDTTSSEKGTAEDFLEGANMEFADVHNTVETLITAWTRGEGKP
jgi:diaminopimelate epimerase